MKAQILTLQLTMACLLTTRGLCQSPFIQSLGASGEILWTNPVPGTIAMVERSSVLNPPAWETFFYDHGTVGLRSVKIPVGPLGSVFYRVIVRTNAPDSSLVLHLPFDNDFSGGAVLDASGYGNHGLRYSSSNWPSLARGPDGSQAGQFGVISSINGDYVAVPYSTNLDRLTNGTLFAWVRYTSNSYHAAAPVDAGWWEDDYSWTLGRNYSTTTKFVISRSNSEYVMLTFPDGFTSGTDGGWHHYGVTWDSINFVGYFDGIPFGTNTQTGIPHLNIGGSSRWIAIGCRNHDGTPNWGDDLYPNNGWIGGFIDDVRIYNRALTREEAAVCYASFDRQPPSKPTNLTARAASADQVEVRWYPSADDFRVSSYRIWRDGVLVGEVSARLYCDAGLAPETAYSYTVEAVDPGGNHSAMSDPITVTTRVLGSQVEIILDEADGVPWSTPVGTWSRRGPTSEAWFQYFVQDDNAGKGTKSFTYRPVIPEAGNYSVYVWYPRRDNGAWGIPVDIVRPDATNTVAIGQPVNGSRWNLLGTYPLPAGTNAFVRIRNDGTSGYVEADAVRFVK